MRKNKKMVVRQIREPEWRECSGLTYPVNAYHCRNECSNSSLSCIGCRYDEASCLRISGTDYLKHDETGIFPWDYLCTEISYLELEEGLEKIGSSAFEDYTRLERVWVPETLRFIGNRAFRNCLRLEHFDGMENLTFWPYYARKSGPKDAILFTNDVFTGTPFAERTWGASIQADDIYVEHLHKYDEEVIIPEGIREIAPFAFENMTSLRSVKFPGTLEKIGAGAFQNTGLTSVLIPASVKEIEGSAFADCGELSEILFGSRETKSNASVFWGTDADRKLMKKQKITELSDWEKQRNLRDMLWQKEIRYYAYGIKLRSRQRKAPFKHAVVALKRKVGCVTGYVDFGHFMQRKVDKDIPVIKFTQANHELSAELFYRDSQYSEYDCIGSTVFRGDENDSTVCEECRRWLHEWYDHAESSLDLVFSSEDGFRCKDTEPGDVVEWYVSSWDQVSFSSLFLNREKSRPKDPVVNP